LNGPINLSTNENFEVQTSEHTDCGSIEYGKHRTRFPSIVPRETLLRIGKPMLTKFPWLQPLPEAPGKHDGKITDSLGLYTDAEMQQLGSVGIVNPWGVAVGRNLNTSLTEPLSRLLDVYAALYGENDVVHYDSLEYLLGCITAFPRRITSLRQLQGVPGLGPSSQKKIRDILQTGTTDMLALADDPRIKTIWAFMKILWVGQKTASTWYDRNGIRSIEDLRSACAEGRVLLRHQQKEGLRFYEDIATRPPMERWESEQFERLIKAEVSALLDGCTCVLGGSYRRGQLTSNDFDFILAPPAPHRPCLLLPALYRRLKARGLIKADLHGSWMSTHTRVGAQAETGALNEDGVPLDHLTIGLLPPINNLCARAINGDEDARSGLDRIRADYAAWVAQLDTAAGLHRPASRAADPAKRWADSACCIRPDNPASHLPSVFGQQRTEEGLRTLVDECIADLMRTAEAMRVGDEASEGKAPAFGSDDGWKGALSTPPDTPMSTDIRSAMSTPHAEPCSNGGSSVSSTLTTVMHATPSTSGRPGSLQQRQIAQSSRSTHACSWNCSTFMGVALWNGCHRRIDLKCYFAEQLPLALIAWTGNKFFNRSVRRLANSLGFTMDDRILIPMESHLDNTPAHRGHHRLTAGVKRARLGTTQSSAASDDARWGRGHLWTPAVHRRLIREPSRTASGESSAEDADRPGPARVAVKSEEDIFDALGINYIPVTQRCCFGHHPGAGSATAYLTH
jgi:DNA polymerase/3'-5' exonuclease PolX